MNYHIEINITKSGTDWSDTINLYSDSKSDLVMAAAYVGEVADETSGLAVIDALEMTGEFHMEGVFGNLDITVTDIR